MADLSSVQADLVARVPIALMRLAEGGHIHEWNRTCGQLLEMDEATVLGRPLSTLVAGPGEVELVDDAVRADRAGDRATHGGSHPAPR